MARLGLKVFYLRTRERKLSQQAVADQMNVRQATLSNIERGLSLPSAPLLVELCKFYDVTPTYLLDEDRGVVPLATERWALRDAMATVGMWIEVSKDSVVELEDGKLLCPLEFGESFYDEEARATRQSVPGPEARRQLEERQESLRARDAELVETLDAELRAHPRRRARAGRAKSD